METDKFTAGEWVAVPEQLHDGKTHVAGRGPKVLCGSHVIAEVDRWYKPGKSGACEESEANARLISAAPDLLAAARARLDEWHSDTRNAERAEPESVRLSRAAISKATGGAA